MECNQMRFIFQHIPWNSFISVTVLGYHWSRKSTADMTYELFSISLDLFITKFYKIFLTDKTGEILPMMTSASIALVIGEVQ